MLPHNLPKNPPYALFPPAAALHNDALTGAHKPPFFFPTSTAVSRLETLQPPRRNARTPFRAAPTTAVRLPLADSNSRETRSPRATWRHSLAKAKMLPPLQSRSPRSRESLTHTPPSRRLLATALHHACPRTPPVKYPRTPVDRRDPCRAFVSAGIPILRICATFVGAGLMNRPASGVSMLPWTWNPCLSGCQPCRRRLETFRVSRVLSG